MRAYAKSGIALLSGAVLFCTGQLRAEALPPLAEVKVAAEAGDAAAQSKLGDAYAGISDYSRAATWYRKAAEQGESHAQYRLGYLYETGPKSIGEAASLPQLPRDDREAMKCYLLAANRGDTDAQERLGLIYRDGLIVKQDKCEAYKWLTFAAKKNAGPAKAYRDQLILQMTQEQILDGQRRVDDFRPGQSVAAAALPQPPVLNKIRLSGISTFGKRRLATINGVSFEVGNDWTVTVEGKPVRIRCQEIKQSSVVVLVEGVDGPVELGWRR